MHSKTGSCYKHSITAESSIAKDSSYIKEGFRLRVKFVKMRFDKKNWQMGRGREIVPKTEQVRNNVKVWLLKT